MRDCTLRVRFFSIHFLGVFENVRDEEVEPEKECQNSQQRINGDREQAEDIDPFVAYAASKLLAEEAVWAFADAYRDADVITSK